MKCGWFGGRRLHAVALVGDSKWTVGAAVTVAISPDTTDGARVDAAAGNDRQLVAVHEALAGEALRSAMGRALLTVAEPGPM